MKIKPEKIKEVEKIITDHGLYNHCDCIEYNENDSYIYGIGFCLSGTTKINLHDLEEYLEEAELRVAGIKKLIEILKDEGE